VQCSATILSNVILTQSSRRIINGLLKPRAAFNDEKRFWKKQPPRLRANIDIGKADQSENTWLTKLNSTSQAAERQVCDYVGSH
jgi:hypothetical protein